MADPSAYLTRLEHLKASLKWEDSSHSEMSERLRLLGILVSIQDTIQFFQAEIIKADKAIQLHIDEDVDYVAWTNPDWIVDYNWMSNPSDIVREQLSNAWTANIDSLLNPNQAKNLAAYLPNSIVTKFNENAGKETLGDFLFLLAGPYYNTSNLRMAIYNAVKSLTDTLKVLQKTMTSDRSPEEYADLVESQWTAYNMVRDGEAVMIWRKYEADKAETSEQMSYEWLYSRRNKALTEFKESAFIAAKMDDCGLDAAKSMARLYSVKNNIIVFDKDASVGRFICKRRVSQDKMNQFFAFRKKIELIQTDMLQQVAPVKERKQKPEVQLDRKHITFKKNGILDPHLVLVCKHLVQNEWIDPETQPNDFCNLFTGKSNNAKIKLTGKIGLGTFVFLFEKMEEQQHITVPKGHSVKTILKAHVLDKDGKYITGLNKTTVTAKHLPVVQECLDFLQLDVDID